MKIVSLAPSNTEILFALGAGKDIAAVTRFCDYPPYAKYKIKIGGWLDVKVESVEKIRPDLVFTSNFLQAELVEKLSRRGIPVVHVDPRTIEDVYASIITIGESIGREDKAQGIVDEMKRRFAKSRSKRQGRRKIKLYCEEWHKPPTVSGNWVPELIEAAGGISYCAKGIKSHEVEVDEIAKFSPEGVVVSWCGFGRRTDLKAVRSRPLWSRLPAFRNGRIYSIDDTFLNRPGPRLVEGASLLAAILDKIEKTDKN